MTTVDTHPHAVVPARSSGARRLPAVALWMTASDHKKVGRLLVCSSIVALAGVAAAGVLAAFERIDAGSTTFETFGQLNSLMRVGLALFVVAPSMLGLAVSVVPLQLGARSLALPRLAAGGFWTWLIGMVLVLVSIAADGGPTGEDQDMGELFLMGMVLTVLGLVAVAGSVATTVLTTRAPGMHLRRVPPFAWSALIAAVGLLLMLPVFLGTLVLLAVDRAYGQQAFGSEAPSSEWAGYALTQPATYVYALAAFGIFAELTAVMARTRLGMRGVLFGGIGVIGVAALAGVTQVRHDLPWSGSEANLDGFGDKVGDLVPYAFFNVVPLLGAIVAFGLCLLAVRGGRPHFLAPFLFAFFGVGMVLTGMLGHVLTPITDLGLVGTVFEEASYVYVGYGAVLALMGAVVFWGPKLWGRRIPAAPVVVLALLGVGSTVAASLPYYIAGFADQPAAAATFDYDGSPGLWNTIVTFGHVGMFVTAAVFAALMVRSFTSHPVAGDDPWDAHTLEWATSSPPPDDNFVEVPTVASPEPLVDLKPSGTGV